MPPRRCTALELAPKQIRVNSVNPGVIITELQKRGGLDEEKYKSFLEHSKVRVYVCRPAVFIINSTGDIVYSHLRITAQKKIAAIQYKKVIAKVDFR